MKVNEKEFKKVKLLGKGKGGYSYLVTDGSDEYVLKQIHHEPCSYYNFSDKLKSELDDYETLKKTGIRMPRLLEVDKEKEIILKEYIEGDLISDYVEKGKMKQTYYDQIKEMCKLVYKQGINIDYYPTNFVVRDDKIYYIDFECNKYDEKWDFETWGKQYWYKD